MTLTSWRKIKTNNKILLVTVCFALIIAAVFKFMILIDVENIIQLRNKILSQKIELAKKIEREKNMNDLNGKLEKIGPELKNLDSLFINVNQQSMIEFVTMLEGIAEKNGVIQTIDINQMPTLSEKKSFDQTPLNLTVRGDYQKLMRYLSDLETMKYYVNINKIELNTGYSSAGGDNLLNSSPESSMLKQITLTAAATIYWENYENKN